MNAGYSMWHVGGRRCGDPGVWAAGAQPPGKPLPVDLLVLRVLAVVHGTQREHQHTLLENVLEYLGDRYGRSIPDHIWLGSKH